MTRVGMVGVVGAIGVVALAACSSDGRDMRPPRPDQNQSVAETATTTQPAVIDSSVAEFVLTPPWPDGGDIPIEHTCLGADTTPVLAWSGAPAGTAAFAIVVVDLNATGASGAPFTHWVVANLEPTVTTLAAIDALGGTIEGANDFGTAAVPVVGWRGPCPPAGETHTYSFEVRALAQRLDYPNGTPAADLLEAIDAATIATATASGLATGA